MKRLRLVLMSILYLLLPGHILARVGSGIITTIAGTGQYGISGDGGPAVRARLYRPFGVTVDARGNLYIADRDNHRIRRVDPEGIITTVAGTETEGFSGDGGPAAQARLNDPWGVAVDLKGNLYIADSVNHRVRRVGPKGIITTFAGTGAEGFSGDGGSATQAQLNGPRGVAVDDKGNVYIADSGNHRVRCVKLNGTIVTVAGTGAEGFSGDGGPATQARLYRPLGVAVDRGGNVYISDSIHPRIRRVSPDGMITTVAGTGVEGFSGDGGPAVQARLNLPCAAVDTQGSIYIADRSNHRIRRVKPDGMITTVAGTGMEGFSGDGGPAAQAQLNGPWGVAVDMKGNVYIADTVNSRVRRVSPDGMIKTVAGSGMEEFVGDGGPAVQARLTEPWDVVADIKGNIYIADTDHHRLRRVGKDGSIATVAGTGEKGFSGDGELAVRARLNKPQGVAVDMTGNVYIADTGNARIRRVSPDGTITTVAGTGMEGFSGDGGLAIQAQLNGPWGVAVDMTGNVYIADTGNARIRRVSPNGTITTVAGTGTEGFSGDGGPATQAELYYPTREAVDGRGNLYIADTNNHRVRRVGSDGVITTVAGGKTWGFAGDGGLAVQACLFYPIGVAVDAVGSLYIADTNNRRVRRVGTDGMITTVAGGEEAAQAQLRRPFGVAVDSRGNVYVADTGNARVHRVGPDGMITAVAGMGEEMFLGDGGPAVQAELKNPTGVAVDGRENLYIADSDHHRVCCVGKDGRITTVAGTGTEGFSGDGGPAVQAALNRPFGVAVDGRGNLYVADTDNHRVRRVGPDGMITTVAGTGTEGFSGDGGPAVQAALNRPFGVAVDGKGNVYIADTFNHLIRRVSSEGMITTVAGAGRGDFSGDGGPAAQAALNRPFGVAVDAKGTLYIADTVNARLRRVGLDGVITTLAGTGRGGFSGDGGPAVQAQLNEPQDVAVDAAGNIYIADVFNNRIRRIGRDGVITTFAGTGARGFSGDGRPATQAQLGSPQGVAVDGRGNVYIADRYNNRVRRVEGD